MKLFLSALMIAVLSLNPVLAHAANNIVGVILDVEGTGKITDTKGQTYDAVVNTKLHPQDIVTTGPNSKLYIQFIDNTEFTLSENAQFSVEEYNFNEKDKTKNYATYSVFEGAFLYVSGLVAKRDNPDVRINIPQGSIGIRGTKFWGGKVNGQYGVIVGEGKVVVKTKGGSTTLIRGQGTNLTDAIHAPTPAKLWSAEKVSAATQTVTLADPTTVGQRMQEARAQEPALRAEHLAAQATVVRTDPVVIAERVEKKMVLLHPEMRPDLLTDEEAAKLKAVNDAKAAADAATDNGTSTEDAQTLRDRLEKQRLDSVDQDTLLKRLNSTKVEPLTDNVTTTVKDAVLPTATDAPANLVKDVTGTVTTRTDTTPLLRDTLKAGTETTKEVVKSTTDAATGLGNRAVTTTTETTTTVKDVVSGAVNATTETTKAVTETPVVKGTTDAVSTTTEKVLAPTSNTLIDTVKSTTDTVKDTTDAVTKPATNAIEKLKATSLLGNRK